MTNCPDDANDHILDNARATAGICWADEAAAGLAHRFDDDPDGDGFTAIPFDLTASATTWSGS